MPSSGIAMRRIEEAGIRSDERSTRAAKRAGRRGTGRGRARYTSAGSHSQAAPRTPLASPNAAGTSRGGDAVRKHPPRPQRWHIPIDGGHPREPAAHDDDVGIEDIDHRRQPSGEPARSRPRAWPRPADRSATLADDPFARSLLAAAAAVVGRQTGSGQKRLEAARRGRSSRPDRAAHRRRARAAGCGPTRRQSPGHRSASRPLTTRPPPVPVPRITPKTHVGAGGGAVGRLGHGQAVCVVGQRARRGPARARDPSGAGGRSARSSWRS